MGYLWLCAQQRRGVQKRQAVSCVLGLIASGLIIKSERSQTASECCARGWEDATLDPSCTLTPMRARCPWKRDVLLLWCLLFFVGGQMIRPMSRKNYLVIDVG